MSRLIDADPLLLALVKRKTYELADGRNRAYGKGVRDSMKDVENQPTIDAVPVVRCKDCKHWLKTTATYVEGDPVYTCPKLTMEWGDEDGYCFMGERR